MSKRKVSVSIDDHLKAWDDTFSTRSWGRYPPEDLIRFMARKFGTVADRSSIRVLEVGCGPGANIWYLAREGYEVAGIDGSAKAVSLAKQRLKDEKISGSRKREDLLQGNFALLPWDDEAFDVVIDIEAIYANTMETIHLCVNQIHRVLKKDGWFFGKMFGIKSTGYSTGEVLEDNTSTNPTIGSCAGLGLAHFFSEDELIELFSDFHSMSLDWTSRSDHGQTVINFEWLVSAQK